MEQLAKFKNEKEDVVPEPVGIFSLLPDADLFTHNELYTMWNLGMEVAFTVKKKPKFCWAGLLVCLLGVAKFIGGALLMICTVGTAASIGAALIGEGISDCIDGGDWRIQLG